jgi:hypothetical protein
MASSTYQKLIATQLTTDFRQAAEIVEVPFPEPAPNEIVVRNQYAGVNATDVNISAGRYGGAAEPPIDLGAEAAGEVVVVGEAVKHIEAGDAVVTNVVGGGYREYHCVRASNALKVPEASPEAVSLVVSGLTASIALAEVGDLDTEETVLVTAAAGGTGQYAVQLARQAGNHVIGTCGTAEKAAMLDALGCNRPINYREQDVGTVLDEHYPDGIDLIYEGVGGPLFDTCVEALARFGRLVTIGYVSEYKGGAESVERPRVYTELMPKSASIRGFYLPHYAQHFSTHMQRLIRLYRMGALQIRIDDRAFEGLEAVPDAVEYLHTGQSQGKVVVRF